MQSKTPIKPFAKGYTPSSQKSDLDNLVFPERVNGKTPDQMNPDEFEQFLGLAKPQQYQTQPHVSSKMKK